MHAFEGRSHRGGLTRRHQAVGALGLAVGIVVLAAAPGVRRTRRSRREPHRRTGWSRPRRRSSSSRSTRTSRSRSGRSSCSTRRATGSTSAHPHHSATTDHSIEASVPHLADGAYVLTWRVISADSHPVHGAYTFTVGQVVGERGRPRGQARGRGQREQDRRRALRDRPRHGVRGHRAADRRRSCSRPRSGRGAGADRAPTRSCGSAGSLLFVATIAGLLLPGPVRGRARVVGGLPYRGRPRGAAHPLRAPHRDPARAAARRAAAALRAPQELEPGALVVGARGAARRR